jgi:AbrB family looped-hinge helix DNA binding protein
MNTQTKKSARGHISPSGRISLPAEFRRALGLERGGNVIVELDGGDIRIRTVREAVAQAQAMSRQLLVDKPAISVEDFLAHRRKDWGEE